MLRDTIVNTQTLAQKPDGVLAFYDISRGKWQSVTRQTVTFGIAQKNFSVDRWMSCISGMKSNQSGYKIPRDGTITSVTVQTQNLTTASFIVRRNGVAIDLHSLDLSNQASKIESIDIDLIQGDWLQVEVADITGNVDNPVLSLELAWRF